MSVSGDQTVLDARQLCIAVQVMQDPIAVYDTSLRIVCANPRLLELLGYSEGELLGRSILTLLPDDVREQVAPRMAAYIQNPVARHMGDGLEGPIRHRDGSTLEAQMANVPVQTTECVLLVATFRKIGDLELDDIRFRGVLEAAPDPILVLNAEAKVVLSNARASHLFEYERLGLFDQHVRVLFSEQHVAELLEQLSICADSYRSGTWVVDSASTLRLDAVNPGGSPTPVEISIAPLPTSHGLMSSLTVRDISERLRLQAAADQMKDEFLATISHELRTPLTSVIGYAELLEDLDFDQLSPEFRNFLEVIVRSARREVRLVDDLLTLVRFGQGNLNIRSTDVDLCTLVSESVEVARPVAKLAKITLSVDAGDAALHVRGDPDRLGEALDNLITNAIKFSPPLTDVNVRIDGEAHEAVVTITDNGPGIPEGEIAHIFERLYRGADAVRAHYQGAGLGLSIVKAIVDAHRGQLSVTSTVGVGSTFELRLPANP
ncbi:MAG: divL 2 [Marmoricola sp.]|nr:divL 2 [Marmoricola sp.]